MVRFHLSERRRLTELNRRHTNEIAQLRIAREQSRKFSVDSGANVENVFLFEPSQHFTPGARAFCPELKSTAFPLGKRASKTIIVYTICLLSLASERVKTVEVETTAPRDPRCCGIANFRSHSACSDVHAH